ncbi:uncharacterized protein METZ01_LOCUS494599, partial [marine metagenome]
VLENPATNVTKIHKNIVPRTGKASKYHGILISKLTTPQAATVPIAAAVKPVAAPNMQYSNK